MRGGTQRVGIVGRLTGRGKGGRSGTETDVVFDDVVIPGSTWKVEAVS